MKMKIMTNREFIQNMKILYLLRNKLNNRIIVELATQLVSNSIEYMSDITTWGQGEYFQLAEETLRLRTGDCEDTSILLAKILNYLEIESFVMLGNFEGVGHAWVEANIGNNNWVIAESTNGKIYPFYDLRYSAEKYYNVFILEFLIKYNRAKNRILSFLF